MERFSITYFSTSKPPLRVRGLRLSSLVLFFPRLLCAERRRPRLQQAFSCSALLPLFFPLPGRSPGPHTNSDHLFNTVQESLSLTLPLKTLHSLPTRQGQAPGLPWSSWSAWRRVPFWTAYGRISPPSLCSPELRECVTSSSSLRGLHPPHRVHIRCPANIYCINKKITLIDIY